MVRDDGDFVRNREQGDRLRAFGNVHVTSVTKRSAGRRDWASLWRAAEAWGARTKARGQARGLRMP